MSNTGNESVYEVEVRIEREVFYKSDTLFGIYSCKPLNYDTRFLRNIFGSVSIQGKTHRLTQEGVYKIKCVGPFMHKQYGHYYQLLSIESEQLDTVSAQDHFLKVILTEKQYATLKSAYPNEKLVDFILADKVNTALTKGIKTETLTNIKEKIKANLSVAELIATLHELNISTNKLTKIIEHFNNSAQMALKTIEKNIYELCNIKSFGFKTVDEIALRRGDNPEGRKRIEACILHQIKSEMDEGHSWIYKSDLLIKTSEMLDIMYELVESTLINMPTDIVYQNEIQVSLSSTRFMELMILEHLKRIEKNFTPPNKDLIADRLTRTEKEQGFEFTEEQRNVIIEGSQNGVMVLNGLAGAGKTATVKGLIDSLGESNYMTAALSGKAVNILSQRNIESSTIHRMLSFKNGGFEYGDEKPLPYRVIVLDEMSMNNVFLVYSVVKAIRNGSKLVLVGDSGQLPAIGFGDVLRDLLATTAFSKYELTQVHRQAAKSGILLLANSIRKGKQALAYNQEGVLQFGELMDQTLVGYANKREILADIVDIAEGYKEKIHSPLDLFDFQVIVPNKSSGELSVRNVNLILQKIFNTTDKLSIKRHDYEFKEGDKIITKGNVYNKLKFPDIKTYFDVLNFVDFRENLQDLSSDEEAKIKPYKFDLYNGTLGYIDSIVKKGKHLVIFIRLEGHEGVIGLEEIELDKIDMAYAATVHRLQGSSIKNVVFAMDYGAYKLLSKQLVYTALTRASKAGRALVETNALYTAINHDASNSRRTFLQQFINDDINKKL